MHSDIEAVAKIEQSLDSDMLVISLECPSYVVVISPVSQFRTYAAFSFANMIVWLSFMTMDEIRPFVEYTIFRKCPVASYFLIAPSQATYKAELSWLHVKAVNSTSRAVCFDGEGGAEVCLYVEGSTITSLRPAEAAIIVVAVIVADMYEPSASG